MMKHLRHILLASLALVILSTSCIEPLEPTPTSVSSQLPDKALVLSPSVLGATVVTKAVNDGVDALGELSIDSLDVYVYKIVSGGTQFFKRYSFVTVPELTEAEKAKFIEGVPNDVSIVEKSAFANVNGILLESDWRQAGYVDFVSTNVRQQYRIYSIANSRMPRENRWKDANDNLSEANLKNKIITSGGNANGEGIYDLMRLMDGIGPGDDWFNIHIKNKNFLMDGMIDEWTISDNQAQQYFTKDNTTKNFPLRRAAAKFLVNVTFNKDFLTSLADEGENGTIIYDAPQLKFSNFMPSSYEISPASSPTGTWLDNLYNSRYQYDFPEHTPSGNLNNDPTSDNYYGKATLSLTTYSYTFAWEDAAEGAVSAPAIVLRVNYKTDNLDPETFFYRIPLVDLTKVNSIDRNYLYIVDAEISSKGAIIEDIKPMDVKLKYKIVPWPNVPDIVTEAQSTQLQYFVAEREYRLRGDGNRFVYLQYFTPKSDPREAPNHNYNKATPMIKNIKVYYYDQDGNSKPLYSYTGEPVYKWSSDNSTNPDVSIEVQPSTAGDGGGHIYVNSIALANHSVKYITFDAVVDFSYDGGESVTHEFKVTHFPLDNLQNIAGRWSSYWEGTESATFRTGESSYTLPSSWGTNYETEIEISYCTYQEFTVATGGNHNGRTVTLSNSQIQNIFDVNNTGQGRNYNAWNTGANDVTTAKYYDGRYYWVTRSWGWGNYTYTYYVADTFWTERTVYYRTQLGTRPSTGNWIDWDASYNSSDDSFTRGGNTSNNTFIAKFFGSYYNRNNDCYVFYQSWGNWYVGAAGDLYQSGPLPNNHMYVIQISKSEDINLGRPMLDNNYQSNDNTVSPAFMIASQLGASSNSSYSADNAANAASHCRNYMEVSENGRRFVGWRLPTQAEIGYILKYQREMANSDVFDAVLTGHWYYTLNSTSGVDNNRRRAETTYDPSSTSVYIRCIRDLTPDEVIELNATGTITAATDPYNN